MTTRDWVEIVLALAVFFGVSGFIGPWLARKYQRGTHAEEEERLAKKFATVEGLNAFRQSLEKSMEACCKEARIANDGALLAIKNADTALDGVRDLTVLQKQVSDSQRQLSEQMRNDFLEPLKQMSETQVLMRENVASLTALVKRLTEEWDNHRKGNT